MTAPAGASYGEVVNQALLEMSAAWQQPIEFATAGAAVVAAQARSGIYRSAVHTLRRYTAPAFTGPHASRPETPAALAQAALAHLADQLTTSVLATGPVLEILVEEDPRAAQTTSLAGRLTGAERAAGAAWDLLATHLTDEGLPGGRPGAAVLGDHSGSVLADAALLAGGMAGLDAAVASAIMRVARDPALTAQVRSALDDVARDCRRTTDVGLQAHARQVASVVTVGLGFADWASVDAIRAASVPTPARLRTAADAAAAVGAYHGWLQRRGDQLAVSDLSTLTSLASRLAGLVQVTVGRMPGGEQPAAMAAEAVTAWRRAHFALRPLRSIQPPPGGGQQAVVLASWADRQLRDGVPSVPGRASWPQWVDATEAIARRLPDLAMAAEDAVASLVVHRRLYLPAPRHMRYPWRPAAAFAEELLTVAERLDAARVTSQRLAAHLPDAAPRKAGTPRSAAGLARQAFSATMRAELDQPAPSVGRRPPVAQPGHSVRSGPRR